MLIHVQPAMAGAPPAWSWSPDPWILMPLAASLLLYAVGVARLWGRAGRGRGLHGVHLARFAVAWLVLGAALVSPLDALGGALFSAHMAQHELLMVVAAPLAVLARPLEAWTWALAPPWRAWIAEATRARAWRRLWSWLTEPATAWALHALVLWGWHVPWLFNAALDNRAIHALQHASFLGSALLFWWSILGRAGPRAQAAALASLFTTMLHTGALGALLAFAPAAWYAYPQPLPFGLAPLEDQQLGGLLMWVPGGAPYLVAGLIVAGGWLGTRAARLR